jgi:hypothetical protein
MTCFFLKQIFFTNTNIFLAHSFLRRSHLDDISKKWIQKRMQTRDMLPPPEESPFNQSMTYPVSINGTSSNPAVV